MYLQEWIRDNYMVLNQGKYFYMTFGLNTTKNEFVFEDGTIGSSTEKHVVLGITINSCLTFCFNLNRLCTKIANELNALTRIVPCLRYNQRRQFFFFAGQLGYCPSI